MTHTHTRTYTWDGDVPSTGLLSQGRMEQSLPLVALYDLGDELADIVPKLSSLAAKALVELTYDGVPIELTWKPAGSPLMTTAVVIVDQLLPPGRLGIYPLGMAWVRYAGHRHGISLNDIVLVDTPAVVVR